LGCAAPPIETSPSSPDVKNVSEYGQSLMPFLRNPRHSGRGWAFAEGFTPNGDGPYNRHERAVFAVNGYKLIRRQDYDDELYNLLDDPDETSNLLLRPLSPAEEVVLNELESLLIDVS